MEKDDKYDAALVYAVCKRAQLELTKLWSKKYFKDTKIVFSCMHPGWCKTDGLSGLFELHPTYKSGFEKFRSAEDGADTINWLLVNDVESGKFWFDRLVADEHKFLACTRNTDEKADELWDWIDELCAVNK